VKAVAGAGGGEACAVAAGALQLVVGGWMESNLSGGARAVEGGRWSILQLLSMSSEFGARGGSRLPPAQSPYQSWRRPYQSPYQKFINTTMHDARTWLQPTFSHLLWGTT
jgi:hypothetical protein